ncbi:V-type ATP synthase subunit A [Candidatus Bathyarchaeota archaeon]|nr:V-type ATP synthase subunit A [Candidatus Bathyarchaeota archaeon]
MPARGVIVRISGSVVEAEGMIGAQMYEMVMVGNERLKGEIIRIEKDHAVIQVYENTSGLKPGEEVIGTGLPLSVELGPGLIGNIFDGIERPLRALREKTGIFIRRGVNTPALSRDKEWYFTPKVKANAVVHGGDIIGTVKESELIEHKIMVPPNIQGRIIDIVGEGKYVVNEEIARVKVGDKIETLRMFQTWPVRRPRPYKRRLIPNSPLITGQRVIDTFFPIAKGGTASIPGGFGTGKTITQQQLAKWSDADVIIYVGCGERGNEMVDILITFPELSDPKSGRPLMERTILIANTSNMPVSAREASIYTAVTIGEYYRDMGYHVALMADSTSRWAEALREISGRLEEMPAEEGFPSYLPTRLGEFYERAGIVETLGSENREGSLSIIGAVSPPGGDFSEPVTTHTKRFTRVFWALDKELADARHYPAINWIQSYSEYIDNVSEWWSKNVSRDWRRYRSEAMKILQREDELKEIVKLVGPEALPDSQRLILEAAKMLRVAFLQQNALDPIDTYSTPIKQFKMLKMIIDFYDGARKIIERGVPIFKIMQLPVIAEMMRMKNEIPNDKVELLDKLYSRMKDSLLKLEESLK